MDEGLQGQLDAASAVANPLRRALYRYVCAADREVGRDEAARAVDASRDLVGSQLDRLAELGLLEVSFRRLTGRSGPGAGRPAKLYRPTALQIDVSVPPRRYSLAADVFAGALRAAGVPQLTVDESARQLGSTLGEEARRKADGRPGRKRTLATLAAVAEDNGFEPVLSGRRMALSNCPFRSLVESTGQLVCRANLAFFQGLLAGLAADGMEAGPVPAPGGGACCVMVAFARAR